MSVETQYFLGILIYLACCIIFYDSAQRYKRFHPLYKVTRAKNTIINIYVGLYLRF